MVRKTLSDTNSLALQYISYIRVLYRRLATLNGHGLGSRKLEPEALLKESQDMDSDKYGVCNPQVKLYFIDREKRMFVSEVNRFQLILMLHGT